MISSDNPRTRTTGSTAPFQFVLKDDATGRPVDITGYSFAFTVDPNENPASSATNLFTASGSIVDAAAGVFQFALTTQQANALVPLAGGAAYWAWVTVTDASGKTDRAKMRLPVTGGPG